MHEPLKKEELAFSYPRSVLDDLIPGEGIVGQERAVGALRTALRTDRAGYNIFICGDFGTGRLSALTQEAALVRGDERFIRDCLYAYNPVDPTSPMALTVPRGRGRALVEAFKTLDEDSWTEKLTALMDEADDDGLKNYLRLLLSSGYKEEVKTLRLLLDRTGVTQRPFIIETHPTFENLFGWEDKEAALPQMGIIPGSYMKASGGFLVLFADELLPVQGLWDELKRHMDSTAMAEKGRLVPGSLGKESRIRPQSLPLQTKVIILASDDSYEELVEKDEDFLRLFKSSPQFDYRIKADKKNISGCVRYLEGQAEACGRRLEDDAKLALLRYSSWFAESRDHLSGQLSLLGDIISEAAAACQDDLITAECIDEVVRGHEYAASLAEYRINEEIAAGDLLVAVDGMKVGIVNGLAVMDRGLASFGTPAVISATVAPGSEGIINIEHEAGLSGEIHDKGLLILEGYLRKMYAASFPLSIYAGICFEQNYSEIDGDSASSSELYALLSAIGEIPVRQDIAVTGSVNQMGFLQPVGGINEKITGFWRTCRRCGLTGRQGVIIPRQNIKSLVLPREVESALEEGSFHIWAVSDIEEGMEIMTGLPSGKRNARGIFPPGTFNRKIEDRLRKLYESGKSN